MTNKTFTNEINIPHPSDSGLSSFRKHKKPNSDICGTINIENVIQINHDGTLETTTTVNGMKQTSPTPSLRSTSISISSIESDALSSIIDSDIDEFEDSKTGCMLKKLGHHTPNPPPVDLSQISNMNSEIGVLISQQIEKDVSGHSGNGPKIASLSIDNSTDVTFGSKRYLNGPVTIQQILVDKPTLENLGKSNPAFEGPNISRTENGTQKSPSESATLKDNTPPSSQCHKKFLNNKIKLITALIVLLTTLIGIILLTAIFYFIYFKNVPENEVSEYLGMILREEWVAQPPNKPLDDLETPVPRVIIAHTATQNCSTKAMCVFRTRFLQTFNIESRSYDDIRYNFLVGGDGNVYVGRGWNKVGAHTKGFNDRSLSIALIGTFNKWTPPENQLNATKWLLSEGVRLKKIVPDYKLYGSRQLDFSDSPGEAFFNLLKKWPNWSNDV